MDFTFGIITGGGEELKIFQIIESIEKQNISNFEIIVVGDCNIENKNLIKIQFDENIKSMWISKKKNIITDNAKYNNIVYLHDYVKLEDGWYNGFLNYGDDWNICMTKIINNDNSRFRDWCLWSDDGKNIIPNYDSGRNLLPYNLTHLSKAMYISGAYWISKKIVMEKYKFDERLGWAQGEDVEWSIRVRDEYDFNMNENSTVKLLKHKWHGQIPLNDNEVNILINTKDYNRNKETYKKLLENHLKNYI